MSPSTALSNTAAVAVPATGGRQNWTIASVPMSSAHAADDADG
jgi:hypothetical protein